MSIYSYLRFPKNPNAPLFEGGIFHYCDVFSFQSLDFVAGVAQLFGRNLPVTTPFCFRPSFGLFFVFGYFLSFFSLLSTPRKIFYYCDGFCLQSFDFATVLAQFFGRYLTATLPFFSRPFFGLFFVSWLFLVFLSLLSTP